MEIENLQCAVTLEHLGSNGVVSKKTIFKDANVSLGRNQLNDMILKIYATNRRQEDVLLKNICIFKKFVSTGKASLTINSKLNIYISNCPPSKLGFFLQGLSIKRKVNGNISTDRQRLYSKQNGTISDISPLSRADLSKCSKTNQVLVDSTNKINRNDLISKKSAITPKRASGKLTIARKRLGDEELSPMSSLKKRFSKTLTREQTQVLNAVKKGLNVFFTGSAGTGKSYLLRKIITSLPPEETLVTASTGVAACQLGGMTLHSFAGIGTGEGNIATSVAMASRPAIAKQWKKCQYLIIDEVSMVDAEFFEKIEKVARVIRRQDIPFGGIQLICTGDFLQLPPISKETKKAKFCFQAECWSRCFQTNFELKDVMRQTDPVFINILQHIRVGKCPDEFRDRLMATSEQEFGGNGIKATRLCTHKRDAADINDIKLQELKTRREIFSAFDTDQSMSSKLDKCMPVQENLELRIGAQVMLTKNLDLNKGLVNGARGVVVSFETANNRYPKVKFAKTETVLHPEKFSLKLPGTNEVIVRQQVPLALAWAISIHKSQGLTLDCVEVSLSKVFETGQAYVALSRAKSLQGLRVMDFEQSCVRANQDVLRFYIKLRKAARLQTESY